MNLSLINHNFQYELEKLIRIFYPFEKITFTDFAVKEDNNAITTVQVLGDTTKLTAELFLDGKYFSYESLINNSAVEYDKECERLLAVCLFDCFVEATGYTPQWGILTGVRPAKLFSRLSKSLGEKSAEDWFCNALKVNDNKLSLCKDAISGEDSITSLSKPKSFSLYISIPFCPTRCSYCSFVSHSVAQSKGLIPKYVELLLEEIKTTAEIAKKCNLRLETVYIGGGTPTTLSAEQIDLVMKTVASEFELENIREYTVEAGRPDTITVEKLMAIKNNGATRISINPQTMNDSVLEAIGRRHTSKQTEEAFLLARECGFDNINMDLIAGLPTDTVDSFKNTVDRVINLQPESVTVHSLSMKRSSRMTIEGDIPQFKIGEDASEMVDYARSTLSENNIFPYYMYRQSKTVGNLENVGYSKHGYECLYNVYIMDETHTILACGASAVTKLREPCGDFIDRIFNYKYPYEYINRFDELMERKKGILEFYEKYPIL